MKFSFFFKWLRGTCYVIWDCQFVTSIANCYKSLHTRNKVVPMKALMINLSKFRVKITIALEVSSSSSLTTCVTNLHLYLST